MMSTSSMCDDRHDATASPRFNKAFAGGSGAALADCASCALKLGPSSARCNRASMLERPCKSCSTAFSNCVRASTSSATAARWDEMFENWTLASSSCARAFCMGATDCWCFSKYRHHCSACCSRFREVEAPGCTSGSTALRRFESAASFGGLGFACASCRKAVLFKTSAYCCNRPCAAETREVSTWNSERSRKAEAPNHEDEPKLLP
mmetsp:Transcript_109919/g.316432  ORF Transcript_109919/g.316432 Transcript_109919/m.316432 type:complete len:207 (-) Transcript_109919:1432-2052(-)